MKQIRSILTAARCRLPAASSDDGCHTLETAVSAAIDKIVEKAFTVSLRGSEGDMASAVNLLEDSMLEMAGHPCSNLLQMKISY